MKKRKIVISILIFALAAACFAGCSQKKEESLPAQSDIQSAQSGETEESKIKDESKAEESTPEQENSKPDEIHGRPADLTNLNFDNKGAAVNDADGPAYVIYSRMGYNKASFDIKLGEIKFNNIRKSDNKFLNAYLFLGMDIFKDNQWANCFDSGLARTGRNSGWHLFYFLYTAESKDTPRWYESNVILNEKHDYRITLDSSQKDGRSVLTAYDLTAGKVADSVEFESLYSKKDGSNTNYLQDYAYDYPDDVKFDSSKKPCESDFEEITLYNTDEGLYMKNIIIDNVKIYKGEEEFDWTEEHTYRFTLWPDVNNKKIDIPIIEVRQKKKDCSFVLDIDMNHR